MGIAEIRALPPHDRRDALEALVCGEIRKSLLMDDEDELPPDTNFFDLGLTSLRLTEIRQRLERLLECEISTSAVFNQPTVEHLLAHLAAEVLADSPGEPPAPDAAAGPDAASPEWDDVLRDLYAG